MKQERNFVVVVVVVVTVDDDVVVAVVDDDDVGVVAAAEILLEVKMRTHLQIQVVKFVGYYMIEVVVEYEVHMDYTLELMVYYDDWLAL